MTTQSQILKLVADGYTTVSLVAVQLQLDPTAYELRSALNDLEYHGYITRDRKTDRITLTKKGAEA